jgi:hypothetical protein
MDTSDMPVILPPGRGEALDQACGNRIACSAENNRRKGADLLGREGRRIALHDQHVDPARDEILNQRGDALEMSLGRSGLNDQIAPEHIAMLGEAADQRWTVDALGHRGAWTERADAKHLGGCLSPCS